MGEPSGSTRPSPLIDGSNDAVEVLDPVTMHFLDINEKACLDLGYHRQEMLSMTVYDIDPTLKQSLHMRISEKLREYGFVIMESLHQRKDVVAVVYRAQACGREFVEFRSQAD
jgi:PAS domain-containing protein